jgi:lipopolysaccharide export system protein LptA
MKYSLLALLFLCSCGVKTLKDDPQTVALQGTWQLVSGTTIAKGDSTFTDYTKDQSMIKIINGTHFAFLKHPVNNDTINKFDAGGGRYSLEGNQYTEHLDYYNNKNWEGQTFTFTVTVSHDTLTQQGVEKVEGEGVDHVIIEKYVRVK